MSSNDKKTFLQEDKQLYQKQTFFEDKDMALVKTNVFDTMKLLLNVNTIYFTPCFSLKNYYRTTVWHLSIKNTISYKKKNLLQYCKTISICWQSNSTTHIQGKKKKCILWQWKWQKYVKSWYKNSGKKRIIYIHHRRNW